MLPNPLVPEVSVPKVEPAASSELKTLLDAFRDQSQAVNNLWAVLQVVGLALLGLVYKDSDLRHNGVVLLGLSILFAGFAYGNREALLRAQRILYAANQQLHSAEFLQTLPKVLHPLALAHTAKPPDHIGRAHWAFSACFLLGTWLPYIVA